MVNNMKLEDIYYSINEEVFKFQYHHGGMEPQCIFMSDPLIKYILSNEESLYSDNKGDGICGKFHGIDVKIYEHSEPQYYLAEGPGMFKRYCEDTEPILYMED